MAKAEIKQFIRVWASGNREVRLDMSQIERDQFKIRLDALQRAASGLFGLYALAVLRTSGVPVTQGEVANQFNLVDQSLAPFGRDRLQGRDPGCNPANWRS